MIKIIIIDDHKLIRTGLKQLLNLQENIEVIADAGANQEGIQLVKALNPDMVLLEYAYPDSDTGLKIVDELLKFNQNLRIVTLTEEPNDYLAKQLLDAGVKSYLTKYMTPEELVNAINSIDQNR